MSSTVIPGPLVLRDLVIDPPILNASGAFDVVAVDPDWNADFASANPLGAFVTKTVTRLPRAGNPKPWVELLGEETLVNSVGLANPGIDVVLETWGDLSERTGCQIIMSVGGSISEMADCIELAHLHAPWVSGFELNLSCPNIHESIIAADPIAVGEAVSATRARTDRPLLVKLTAACGDVAAVAQAAQRAGGDAITAINTMPVRALDDNGAPKLGTVRGGMSGRMLHPIALDVVATVAQAVDVPIIGVGGIATRAGAMRMFACGASAVGIGTAAAIAPSVLVDLAGMWVKQTSAH